MTDPSTNAPQLRAQLQADLARIEQEDDQSVEAATLRLVMCAVHDRDADARAHDQCKGCDDSVIQGVLALMVRQREESASKYEDAGRIEMADRERQEIDVIQRYLPEQIQGPALEEVVQCVISELDARGLKDLGRCMTELKTRYSDRLDPIQANRIVKRSLAS